ncbi:60S ribosomal protein L6 [Hypocenomyce scalaris]|nr:60S ribosomal protein L6 [Hypocenomyce scalaris]
MVQELARGISAHGRSRSYKRRGLHFLKKKNNGEFPKHEKKQKTEEAPSKAPKFYPADDVKKPLQRKAVKKPTKLRASIQPGTVLILLAGRFKGKRCVFLKQQESGLLLVTGPFKVNGVPLKRVNQAYVIATSTLVDISKVDVSKFDDAYFKSSDKAEKKKGEDGFFDTQTEKKELGSEYIENQKKVDAALLTALKPELKGYLSARFSLKKNDRPHLMAF